MGEYARSLAIAHAAAVNWPGADIHFVLSREAPYASAAPFPATVLASSPTFHSAAVIELLHRFRPDVVIFDNAGRTAQLRAAQRAGARVVYISARRRQRRKAFRWRWMALIDEHWIAYPEFIAGGLSFCERLKLRIAGRPVVRYLDVILSRAGAAQCAAARLRAGVAAGFVLIVPGAGTGHPGARDAAEQFAAAGRELAARGIPTVYVGPLSSGTAAGAGAAASAGAAAGAGAVADAGAAPDWHPVGSLPQAELAELLRSARLVIANGGSTLLQSIACGNACVAVAIARDQSERIRRCVDAGVAVAAALDAHSMVQAAQRLLQNDAELGALKGRATRLGLADGVEVALGALRGLLA